jgi:hypothetical protein
MEIELRRHTDSDCDALTEQGVQAALQVRGQSFAAATSCASRAAPARHPDARLLRCALGERVPGGAVVEEGPSAERDEFEELKTRRARRAG